MWKLLCKMLTALATAVYFLLQAFTRSASKLQSVDFVITNSNNDSKSSTQADTESTQGTPPIHLNMQLRAQSMVHILSGEEIALPDWSINHQHKAIAAIAGLVTLQRFFDSLSEQGIEPDIGLPFRSSPLSSE